MINYKCIVSDKQGLHATNAMSLSKAATEYESRITLTGTKGTADCKNVFALMSLGVRRGGSLEPTVEGPSGGQASGLLKGLMCAIL